MMYSVAWTFAERADPIRFLIRDHDRKFMGGFDVAFEVEHIRTGSQSGSSGPLDQNNWIGS